MQVSPHLDTEVEEEGYFCRFAIVFRHNGCRQQKIKYLPLAKVDYVVSDCSLHGATSLNLTLTTISGIIQYRPLRGSVVYP
jgi:hypothetical protein